MKRYLVDVEFTVIEFTVYAKDKRSAKKKALAKILKMNPLHLVHKSYPDNKRQISIEER
jgi:hypothetical protein